MEELEAGAGVGNPGKDIGNGEPRGFGEEGVEVVLPGRSLRGEDVGDGADQPPERAVRPRRVVGRTEAGLDAREEGPGHGKEGKVGALAGA